jgi:hypothetical protein
MWLSSSRPIWELQYKAQINKLKIKFRKYLMSYISDSFIMLCLRNQGLNILSYGVIGKVLMRIKLSLLLINKTNQRHNYTKKNKELKFDSRQISVLAVVNAVISLRVPYDLMKNYEN